MSDADQSKPSHNPGHNPKPKDSSAKPHYAGHRERLRARFLKSGADGIADYELLELLLFQAKPRGDVKPLAKDLLARFGSFAAVIGQPADKLKSVSGVGDSVIAALKTVQAAALKMMQEDVMEQPVLSSWTRLLDYCRASLAYEDTERFRILFLNRKNALIADELQQKGTVDHTPVYPREVIRRALDLGATAIIMVHNHPSGDTKPSRADIDMTREVKDAAEKLGITLHDHVIVSKKGTSSFKTMGLL